MQRSSLALRVPAALLPSTTTSQPLDSEASEATSGLEDELHGLVLRPPQAFGRSTSRPPAHLVAAGAGVAPHPGATGPPPFKPPAAAAPTFPVHIDATSGVFGPPAPCDAAWAAAGGRHSLPEAPAPAVQAQAPPPVQRVGSCQPTLHGGSAGSQDCSPAPRTGQGPAVLPEHGVLCAPAATAAQPSSTCNSFCEAAPPSEASRCASPEPRYSEDEFEEEEERAEAAGQESSRRAAPPAHAASTSAGSSGAAARSTARAAGPAPASTRSRPGSAASSCSPSSRPLSRSSSRLGYMTSTAAAEAKRSVPSAAPPGRGGSRPGSASPTKRLARPSSTGRPPLEMRVARQMDRDPADWTVAEVCDWLELIGLGQYRRRFVHHAVNGTLLLKLSNEELRVEVGIGPLGHREGLLTAINDLEEYWQQQQEARQLGGAGGAPSGSASEDGGWATGAAGQGGHSRPGSPLLRGVDYSLQRAYQQRARLLRDLEKAEGREAHRRSTAEQALRVVDQAAEEVRKLQASILELDRQLGWQAGGAGAAAAQFDPMDVHGAVAWQPAGLKRAPPRRPGSGSPCSPGGRSAGGSPGSPMSRVSRRIMEAQQGAGGAGGFLDRLSRDIEVRQAKAAEAARRAGRYCGGAEERLAERERELRDLCFVRDMVAGRSDELAAQLGSSDAAQVAAACDEAAETYQEELGLSGDAVAAVKRLGSAGKKAARLAGAMRSAQFMERLRSDLATRESRLAELQHQYYKLERGNAAEQQERADLAAAQAHFALLGWPAHDLQVAPSDAAAGCDDLLAALLRRAGAVQEARQRDKSVDWEQPEWWRDRLADMQREHNAALASALEKQQAEAAEAAVAQKASGKQSYLQPPARQKEVPQPGEHLQETVELLAACRPAELELLEGLAGYKKLLMTWRAVRAQQFVAFTRRDLEARAAKAAALEKELYPSNTRVLPKQEFDQFFDRLMADTQRRAQNREELAEQARSEALAKLMKSAPQPLNHQRQQRLQPMSAGPGAGA